ncbi:hypothetical protein OHA27_12435 [Streptomyces sp. NBC_01619]|uniref:Uncharacterized protein n=1 Tax=Streptomyces pratisoli TaxID=3139917 RepID=A0ACC6QA48_9ACTN|nr:MULTISPECIES: hypothetical protein [unclassified Streptomyces]MCX4511100.1 hypothetical protein [Streptomyces sp. NBC_01619]
MSSSWWQRSLVLAVASVALATGTACAAQTPQGAAAGMSLSAGPDDLLDRLAKCGSGGEGGRGGEGGEGGRGGGPGQPGEPGEPGQPGRTGTSGCFRIDDLPDKPKDALSETDKAWIVLAVLSGETTRAEVAEKYHVPEAEVDTWKRQFLNDDAWSAVFGPDPFTA